MGTIIYSWDFCGHPRLSDRPKFGSVPVPAEIGTGAEISVSVPARFNISVSAEISVQMWTEIQHFKILFYD